MEGSQIPVEYRINQLSARLDSLINDGPALGSAPVNINDPQDFRALAMMMQSKMLGDALGSNDDDNSNPMAAFMNPMIMGMNNPMTGNNPMQAMNNPMMGSNPMLAAMMMGSSPYAMPNNYMPNTPQIQSDSMVFPLQGRVSSPYGHRHHPLDKHEAFHSGVDIAAPQGSAIRAPWAGRVVFVGHADGFGSKTVIVAHENNKQADGKIVYSVFGHNQDVFVKEGDYINQGEVFATVGSDGHSTGPHLHWETRIANPNLQAKEVFEKHVSMTVDPLTFTTA